MMGLQVRTTEHRGRRRRKVTTTGGHQPAHHPSITPSGGGMCVKRTPTKPAAVRLEPELSGGGPGADGSRQARDGLAPNRRTAHTFVRCRASVNCLRSVATAVPGNNGSPRGSSESTASNAAAHVRDTTRRQAIPRGRWRGARATNRTGGTEGSSEQAWAKSTEYLCAEIAHVKRAKKPTDLLLQVTTTRAGSENASATRGPRVWTVKGP